MVDSARSLQSPSVATVTSASTTPVNSREDYNKETDGKPCYPWNWGKECGFSASHGASAEHYLHICAWCAYKFRRQLNHREQYCLKKRRFLDKKAAGESAVNTPTVSEVVSYVVSNVVDTDPASCVHFTPTYDPVSPDTVTRVDLVPVPPPRSIPKTTDTYLGSKMMSIPSADIAVSSVISNDKPLTSNVSIPVDTVHVNNADFALSDVHPLFSTGLRHHSRRCCLFLMIASLPSINPLQLH